MGALTVYKLWKELRCQEKRFVVGWESAVFVGSAVG